MVVMTDIGANRCPENATKHETGGARYSHPVRGQIALKQGVTSIIPGQRPSCAMRAACSGSKPGLAARVYWLLECGGHVTAQHEP
jgi:hypothetical protein